MLWRRLGRGGLRIGFMRSFIWRGIVRAVVEISVEEDVVARCEEAVVVGWGLGRGVKQRPLFTRTVWGVVAVDEDQVPDQIFPVFVPCIHVTLHGREMSSGESQIQRVIRAWAGQANAHGYCALVSHVGEADTSACRLYPLYPLCDVGFREQHQGGHAQAARRNVLERFAAIAAEVCGKLDSGRHAVKVGLQIRSSEERVGDGCDFLQRDGDDVRQRGVFGKGIEQGRRERLRVDQVPGSIEGEEV